MKIGALVLAVTALFQPGHPTHVVAPPAGAERPHACMTPDQARDILIGQRLVAPFRAFGEAVRGTDGDVVGLQLCRMNDDFVYDVTLLRHDGRVTHILINARSGAPVIRAGR